MSVYLEAFGTDWDELDRDEVLHRAFALGAAEGLGASPPDDELDRLRSQVWGRYGRSLVDLAYDEGRAKAGRPHPDQDDEEVWSVLVESEFGAEFGAGGAETFHRSSAASRTARRTALPESIALPAILESERDDLAKLGLPEFLR